MQHCLGSGSSHSDGLAVMDVSYGLSGRMPASPQTSGEGKHAINPKLRLPHEFMPTAKNSAAM